MILIGNYFEEGRLNLYQGLEAIHSFQYLVVKVKS